MKNEIQNGRIKIQPARKKMAEEVEKTANEYAKEGWNLLTFSVTLSAKAILVFEKPDARQ